IGRLLAFENSAHVCTNLVINGWEARSIADEAAGFGELAPLIDRWNGMAGSQERKLLAAAYKKRIGLLDKSGPFQREQGDEGGTEPRFGGGFSNMGLHPLHTG